MKRIHIALILLIVSLYSTAQVTNNNNFKQSIMNQTKTAVILSIVAIVGIGVIIYALRDNFKSQKSVKTSSEIVAE